MGCEDVREPVGAVIELTVGQPSVADDKDLTVGIGVDDGLEEVREVKGHGGHSDVRTHRAASVDSREDLTKVATTSASIPFVR